MVVLCAIIYWLLKDRKEMRQTYSSLIAERDAELKELRDTTFTLYRETSEQAHKSSQSVAEAVRAIRKMAEEREQAREREMDRLRGGSG